MVRYRGRKALYEVMSKSRVSKPAVEPLRSQTEQKKPQEEIEATEEIPQPQSHWLKKPDFLQLNAGRIEFSLPYQVAIVVVLVLILLVLAAYNIGRLSASRATEQISPGPAPTRQDNFDGYQSEVSGQTNLGNAGNTQANMDTAQGNGSSASAASSVGNNYIIIKQYHARADLEPVQKHFAASGIATEIVRENGTYFLRTTNLYDNPNRQGSNGYRALQEIIKVGAEYKGLAPAGLESFAPNYFSDAYGKAKN